MTDAAAGLSEQARKARAEYFRKWAQAHPEKIKDYRQRNKDKMKAATKAWRQRNPEKVKAYQAAYWERRAGRTGEDAEQRLSRALALYGRDAATGTGGHSAGG